MNKLSSLIIVTLICIEGLAQQRVGINTTTPQAALDVKGNHRFGGSNRFLTYDSVSGKISWNNSSLFVPIAQSLMRHSEGSEGLFYGNSQLEYRNQFGSAVFFVNWNSWDSYVRRLGINNATPQFPLSLNGDLGDKISLWTDGSATHYGFGIQGGLLQVFSKTSVDDIAFGFGSSSSFTERMRVKGNGNVGIGTNNPAYLLDIGNRMRIRSGGDNTTTAGVWLNNTLNSEAAFIGMEDNSHVGFFGVNLGFKFGMNTQTGALKVNGNEGQAGQLLQSNGSAPADWRNNPVTEMYNHAEELPNAGGVTLVSSTNGDVPGLNKTLNLAKPSKVVVQFMVFAGSAGCAFCAGTTFDLFIDLNGGNTGRIRNSVGNGDFLHVTGCRIFSLPAGTHTIKISARNLSGPDLLLGQTAGNAYPSFMTLQVVPQN